MTQPIHHLAPTISVSIVTHHSALALLTKTVTSLIAANEELSSAFPQSEVQLHIIDNSLDANYHAQLIQQLKPWLNGDTTCHVTIIKSDKNDGYGAGHNLSIMQADSDFHLVLNPDVELSPSSLVEAVNHMRNCPDTAMVSPLVTNDTGQREYLCKRYPSILTLFLRGFGPAILRRCFKSKLDHYEMRDISDAQSPYNGIDIASGCCMFTRTALLQKAHGFSDTFFLYFEDFDLSLRLSHLGDIVYLPSMKIIHHGGYSAQKGLRHIHLFIVSATKFFHKNGWKFI